MGNVDFSRLDKTSLNVNKIIGLPPAYIDNPSLLESVTINSMPIVALYPAYPAQQSDQSSGGGSGNEDNGLKLFQLSHSDGRTKYNDILKGIVNDPLMGDNCVYAAFLNDTSITESFGIEFGDSKFESIGNIASQSAAELRYITGKGTMKESMTEIGNRMQEGEGVIGELGGMLVKGAGTVLGAVEGGIGAIGGEAMKKLLSGSRVDFPQIWQGASYTPSYSFTVRLYNPNSASEYTHKKYVLDNLAKLLAFTIPIADSNSTFSYPVLCSAVAPGLFQIDSGFISNLDVIKGGDSNDIAFSQRTGTIDIRITINSLYNSIVASSQEKPSDPFRPTFKKYMDNLKTTMGAFDWPTGGRGVADFIASGSGGGVNFINSSSSVATTTPTETAQSRVNQNNVNIASGLQQGSSSD